MKWDGTGDLGKDILSGDITTQRKFSKTVQNYFECLSANKMARTLKKVNAELSLAEYKRFWKKKKEETATSPFGLHIGHYKAATEKDEILNVHRIMLLLPFQMALVPYRWKRTVHTMIEKDPGQPWIHRLRIIELFDSQVNAGFQIFIGRKMVWEAVKADRLHPASYGSTPGKMAASAVLQKILCIDQMRLERRAGGMFDCDATGCYDRILPPLASIHLQALGLGTSIATLLARLMFVAKRFVKTKHGVSKKNIQTTQDNPLYGIGQGNGGGPAIWLSHLTIMFTALAVSCQGFIAKCTKRSHEITTIGTGYVDDVTLITTLTPTEPQTETKVRNKLRGMAKTWEQLLFITGGKLELSKCFWIPITWRWRKGEPVMNPHTQSGIELKITESESGNKITIPKLLPSKAEKRLGISHAVDGNCIQEYKNWKQYTETFATKIQKARLDRVGGYHAYRTMWCSKFRYSAPVICFSKAQLEVLQKKIIGKSLAAAGYNSKMPRAVVFGPTKYGGMQWESPYSILIYEQIKLIIGSIRLQDTVGKLIIIQLRWMQLIAGTSVPIMEETKKIPYLQNCWLTAVHNKLVNTNIKIKVADKWYPKPRRENDRVIMDYVIKYIPEHHWKEINQCRLYLKAITFSDLTTMDGTAIPANVYGVTRETRHPRLDYPTQKKTFERKSLEVAILY